MDIIRRFPENPILTPSDIKPSIEGMKIECLLNPGVFRFNEKIWLLLRVAERPEQKDGKTTFPILNKNGEIRLMEFDNSDPRLDLSDPRVINFDGKDYLTTLSHLRLVCSDNGVDFHEPAGYDPIMGKGDLETFGIEDCRVATMGDTYYLTFTQVSENGVGVGLMTTRNWKEIQRHGMIIPPHNKDCAIFEEKINNKYFALHRPSSPELGGNYIWISESPDLLHWGNHKCIAHSREGMWDSVRVGAGGAPIRTEKGWLEIYHGANENNRYCLGALLLDHTDPSILLARSGEPIVEPAAEYEKTGFFGNVVFTNGHIVNGDEITIYYGASDEVICAGRLSITEILSSLQEV
jgi:predicted GH43/DUF377 family glycosyl hydrolase